MKKKKVFIYLIIMICLTFLTNIETKCLVETKHICNNVHVMNSLRVFSYTLLILKIMIPIIIIIKGISSLIKAIASGDDNGIKPAVTSFIQRLIVGITVAFIPTLIGAFGKLVEGWAQTEDTFSRCTNCIARPSECVGTEGNNPEDDTASKDDDTSSKRKHGFRGGKI